MVLYRMWYAMGWGVILAFLFIAFVVHAQSPPLSVDLNKAQLVWTWTQGTEGPVEKWLLRCGPTSGNWTVLKEVPTPAARSYLIKGIPLTVGNWVCIVQGANTFGAGLPSPEVTFQAGQAPGKVDTLTIGAQ